MYSHLGADRGPAPPHAEGGGRLGRRQGLDQERKMRGEQGEAGQAKGGRRKGEVLGSLRKAVDAVGGRGVVAISFAAAPLTLFPPPAHS